VQTQRRAGFWRVVCGVAVAIAFIGLGGAPAMAAPSGGGPIPPTPGGSISGGSISGIVSDASGNPLSGICVNIENGPGTQSDGSGAYSIAGLGTGSFEVEYSDCNPTVQYLPQWYLGRSDSASADAVGVIAGADTALQNVHMVRAASRLVTVTGPGGGPLAGICVDADLPNSNGWDFVRGATTASDGTYTIDQLPPATLRIEFHVCNSSGGPYIPQWYANKADFNDSTPVVLAPGDDRQGVDAQLASGVEVAGRVTDAAGNPIAGINVNVNPTNQGTSGYGQTDSNGDYTTSAVAAGTYNVQFDDGSSVPVWATQYWNGKLSWNSATVLTLSGAGGAVHGAINARLTRATTIRGTVTVPGGAPAAGMCVDANVATSNGADQIANTTTASDGTYMLGGLPAITVKVSFHGCNGSGPYLKQWWNQHTSFSTANALTLAPGQIRSGIDAQLVAAAQITGTVTDSGGHPLSGICAQASTTTFFGGLAQTDSSGNYAISLSRSGRYRVQFVDCNDTHTFAGQWWKQQPTSSSASIVTVVAGHVVDNIDARLVAGATGSISGKVVNLNGIAMTSVCVIAYLPDQYAVFGMVHSDGNYTIPNVPSGTYALGFLGCTAGDPSPTITDPQSTALRYAGLWWDGAPVHIDNNNEGGPDPIAQGATLVSVAPGQHLSGYNRCFGCSAIAISSITPGRASLTVAFTTPGFVTPASIQSGASTKTSALTYTVTCTPSDGTAAGSATGTSSPITVAGLTSRAPYTCVVAASDGHTAVGRSAVSSAVLLAVGGPIPGAEIVPAVPVPGELPRTGTSSGTLTEAGIAILVLGAGLLAQARHRQMLVPVAASGWLSSRADQGLSQPSRRAAREVEAGDRDGHIAELRALVQANESALASHAPDARRVL